MVTCSRGRKIGIFHLLLNFFLAVNSQQQISGSIKDAQRNTCTTNSCNHPEMSKTEDGDTLSTDNGEALETLKHKPSQDSDVSKGVNGCGTDEQMDEPSIIKYSRKDFKSSDEDSSTDDTDDMGAALKKDHSAEKDQSTNKPSKLNMQSEPKTKKYKQTTLDVHGGASKKTSSPKSKDETSKRWSLTKRLSDKDTQDYREGYPGKTDNPRLKDNLRFYRGEIESTPDGDLIDVIHKEWTGNYRLLEQHHGYIQWIFPIREDGMNWQAQALQVHEAQAIQNDKEAKKRVLRSYKMMLDFYGMKLSDSKTGTLERSRNWEDRYDNLNRSTHNYLRITRILKSLGELGYEHLKKEFLQFVLREALEYKTLKRTLRSCRDYWIGTLKSDLDREELYQYIEEFS